MKIVEPSYEVLTYVHPNAEPELRSIADIARTCYKSTDLINFEDVKKFLRTLIKRKHYAMLEHSTLTVKFVCDRGISHEIVRHRMASYAQESTRWCNYSKDKFGSEITVVRPEMPCEMAYLEWKRACEDAEKRYLYLTSIGVSAQEARAVLPTCLKTELVMTANYREWRHFFELRAAPDAHPQIRHLSKDLLRELVEKIPVIFDDIHEKVMEQERTNEV